MIHSLSYCGGNVWLLEEQSPCRQGTGRKASKLPFHLSTEAYAETGDSGVISSGGKSDPVSQLSRGQNLDLAG